MAENISIIKNALKSFSPAGEYDKTTFLLAAGKLSSTNPAESNLLKKIAEGDNFTAFDKDGNGKITDREIEEAAKFTSPNDILNEADLSEALSRLSRATRRRPSTYTPPAPSASPATSTSPSSPSSPPPSTSPPVQVPQINTYSTDSYKKNKVLSGDVKKTVVLDTVKLDENRDVKIFIGEDQLAHFLIYLGDGYDKDHSRVEEYTIPLETLQSTILGLDSRVFLSFNSTNYAYDVKFATKDRGAQSVINTSSPDSKGKVTQLIKEAFLSDSSLSVLKNATGVQFREARGVEDLIHAKYGDPAGEIPPPEEYTGSISELDTRATSLGGTSSKAFWIGERSGVAKLVQYTDTSTDLTRKGQKFYRLIFVQTDSSGNPTNKVAEHDIKETELGKIAKQDAQKVDFSNIENVKNWLIGHFDFNKSSLDAYIKRSQGKAQFGEISLLFTRESNGANLTQAFQNLSRAPWKKVADTPGSFKDGKLTAPVNYTSGLHGMITSYFDKLSELYALRGSTGEEPAKLPPFQIGSTFKQIILESDVIRILTWEMSGGRPIKVKSISIDRGTLEGTSFEMFAKLTPRYLNMITRHHSQERQHLEKMAKIYFGYGITEGPSTNIPGIIKVEDITNTTLVNMDTEITNLRTSRRRP